MKNPPSSKESKELLRIDKNIAQNSVSFTQFESDENLIRNLTIFFSVIAQGKEDLFGFIKFDPKTFAKTMGYKSDSRLFDIIEEPYQQKRLGAKEYKNLLESKPEEVFRTRMENALYRMMSDPLELKHRGQSWDGNKYISIRSILLIEEITIIIDKANRGKKYYSVKFSNLIKDNLINFFSFIDFKVYVELPERHKSFYLMLCNLKHNMLYNVDNNFSYSIDDLCAFLGINDAEMRHRKKKINSAIEEIAAIEGNLGIELVWEKNGKFAYKPTFVLSENPPELPDKKAVFESIFSQEYLRYCFQFFTGTFYEKGVSNVVEHRKEFVAWINNPNKDMNDKMKAYKATGEIVFKENFKYTPAKASDYVVAFKYE